MANNIKRKPGRPKIIINWDVVASYLRAQCDTVGIAGILGISPDTLYTRCKKDNKIDYTVFSAQKKSEGKDMLRAKQFTTAMGDTKNEVPPNVTMQIWLGKQYLGQKDKHEIEQTNLNPDEDKKIIEEIERIKKIIHEGHRE